MYLNLSKYVWCKILLFLEDFHTGLTFFLSSNASRVTVEVMLDFPEKVAEYGYLLVWYGYLWYMAETVTVTCK